MKWIVASVAAALAATGSAAGHAANVIGVTRAVEIAENSAGGQVLEVELENRGGRLVYEVEMAKGRTLRELDIDASSGKVLRTRTPRLEGYWKRFSDAEEFRQAELSRPLSELLKKLERSSGGRVMDASFEIEGGQARYEVEISTAAGVAELYLDPRTGHRLAFAMDD